MNECTVSPPPDDVSLWVNPRIYSLGFAQNATTLPIYWRVVDDTEERDYRSEDWEMAVTFRRKAKKWKVGDRVRHPQVGVIEAVSTSYGGVMECWARLDNGSHITWYAHTLERAHGED